MGFEYILPPMCPCGQRMGGGGPPLQIVVNFFGFPPDFFGNIVETLIQQNKELRLGLIFCCESKVAFGFILK